MNLAGGTNSARKVTTERRSATPDRAEFGETFAAGEGWETEKRDVPAADELRSAATTSGKRNTRREKQKRRRLGDDLHGEVVDAHVLPPGV